jgi:hypothetical protein
MATKKTTTSKSAQPKSKLLKAAEKIGTIAGTIAGKKNQLIKKAGRVIESTKAKVHELTAKKEAVKKAARKDAKLAVKKVSGKVSEVKKAAKKDAKIALKKAVKKIAEVKKVTRDAAAKAKAEVEKSDQ